MTAEGAFICEVCASVAGSTYLMSFGAFRLGDENDESSLDSLFLFFKRFCFSLPLPREHDEEFVLLVGLFTGSTVWLAGTKDMPDVSNILGGAI